MYGVPPTLDLTFLHGTELIQVCLGQYQVQFHFHPTATLLVEGDWELFGAGGMMLDQSKPAPRIDPYQLHRLLGQKVVTTEVSSPQWIALRFEAGYLLRVLDSSAEYESFTIEPGGIIV
jgi:hypothetical protein